MSIKYFNTLGQAEEGSLDYGVNLDQFIALIEGKFRVGIVEYDDEEHCFIIKVTDPHEKPDSEYLKEILHRAMLHKSFNDYSVSRNGTTYNITFRKLSFLEYDIKTLELLREKGRKYWESQ